MGINDFKKIYRPRTNVVKDESGDWFADSYSIVAKCRNYLPHLLNVHGVNDIKHTYTHSRTSSVVIQLLLSLSWL